MAGGVGQVDIAGGGAPAMAGRPGEDVGGQRIRTSLFGSLEVRVGDRRLGPDGFGAVKPKELFEVLLLARGHLVTKELLAESLWRDERPMNVVATLETYVSVVRRHLHRDRAIARRILVTASGAYRLGAEHLELDIDRFDDLLRRAEGAGHRQRVALREEAVQLAIGDILEDAPYASWVQEERRFYRDRVAGAHLLLAEDALVDRDPVAQLRHGEAALRIIPLSEGAFRAVMLAHHALGRSGVARTVFERCRDQLDAELGLDPTTETVTLAGLIDAGAPVAEIVAAMNADDGHGPVTIHARAERRSSDRTLPFVGRQVELERIARCVDASRAGQLIVVVVEGRPGVGRSALLDRLQMRLDGAVGRSDYSPLEHERPTLPLSVALQRALTGGDGEAAARAYARSGWLGAELPALEALRDVVAAQGPMTLLLDDLQWADSEVIFTMEWLRRNAPDLPLAVIATQRTDPRAGPAPTLLPHAEHLRLASIQPGDCTGQASAVRELARLTGGDPGLLKDCWRWMQAGGRGPSPSLRDVVLRVVRGLSGDGPVLLKAAAGLQAPIDVDDLVDALGYSPRHLAKDLELLCDCELLERGDGGLHFRAPVIQAVLADPAPSPLPFDEGRADVPMGERRRVAGQG